jgi:hypothetical protein
MRPSSRGQQSGPLPIGSAWRRSDGCVVRTWVSGRVRGREWLGSRDADERRDPDDADTIDPDGERSDATDVLRGHSDAIDPDGKRSDPIAPDCHGVPNHNRGRGISTTSHDNVWGQSRCRRGSGRGSRVAERRIEQHAVGLDRLCHPRGGGPHRRDRLVVAEALRPRRDEDAGGWRRGRWIIVAA